MAKAPPDKVYDVVYETDPIPLYEKENSSATYRLRIVRADTEPKLRLDIRQHIITQKYTGFTARGIAVSIKQAPDLIKGINNLMDWFKKEQSKSKGKKK